MRILLTGVSGQVGSALRPRLHDHDVIAADRTVLDLTKPEEIPSLLDGLSPDLIINPAAYTAVDKAEDETELANTVNAIAPGEMAQWAARNSVPFIHFSTDYVFDGHGERPWREDDPPSPLSSYGTSKLLGEEAVRAAGGVFLIIRTSWVYAAIGKNFLRTIAHHAGEKEMLRVVADQIGAPTSAALIADTVIAMTPDRIELFAEKCSKASGIVHLAARGETTWHGFATAIVDGLKVRGMPLTVKQITPIRTEDYPTKATRPHNSRLDLSRLRQTFGIEPMPWIKALEVELDRMRQIAAPSS